MTSQPILPPDSSILSQTPTADAAARATHVMPLALCCDDPSQVRWQIERSRRREARVQWNDAAPPAQDGDRPDEESPS